MALLSVSSYLTDIQPDHAQTRRQTCTGRPCRERDKQHTRNSKNSQPYPARCRRPDSYSDSRLVNGPSPAWRWTDWHRRYLVDAGPDERTWTWRHEERKGSDGGRKRIESYGMAVKPSGFIQMPRYLISLFLLLVEHEGPGMLGAQAEGFAHECCGQRGSWWPTGWCR